MKDQIIITGLNVRAKSPQKAEIELAEYHTAIESKFDCFAIVVPLKDYESLTVSSVIDIEGNPIGAIVGLHLHTKSITKQKEIIQELDLRCKERGITNVLFIPVDKNSYNQVGVYTIPKQ